MNPLHTSCEWGSISGVRAYLYMSTNHHHNTISWFPFGSSNQSQHHHNRETTTTTTTTTATNSYQTKFNNTGIEIQDPNTGCNALHIACKYSHYDIILLLLETLTKYHTNSSKLDIINTKDYHNGWTPLHYIASYHKNNNNKTTASSGNNNNNNRCKSNSSNSNQQDSLSIVMKLIEHGALVNVQAMFGTPLHCAIRKGNDRIVQYLIEYAGAQIIIGNYDNSNNDDNNGNTGENSNENSLTKLIVSNRDYTVSPLDVACQRGDKNMIRYLLDHGALQYESISYKGDCIHYVLANWNNVTSTTTASNSYNYTKKKSAHDNNQYKIVRMLIKDGANLLHVKNNKSIFDYDWMNVLLLNKDYKFHHILENKNCYRYWNLLALICYTLYGAKCTEDEKYHIELFQLIEDKNKQVKMPPPGSKYLSSKYLAPPPPPPTTEESNEGSPPTTNDEPTAATDTSIIPVSAIQQQHPTGPRVLMTQHDIQLLRTALEEYTERMNNTPTTTTTTMTNPESQQQQQPPDVVMPGTGHVLGSVDTLTMNQDGVLMDVSNQTSLLLSSDQEQLSQHYHNIPDFKSASYDDYNWMVHALASISICPLAVIQFITLQCFPSQLRVQRMHGCTPLLLACQRIYDNNTKHKKNTNTNNKKMIKDIASTTCQGPVASQPKSTNTADSSSPNILARLWSLNDQNMTRSSNTTGITTSDIGCAEVMGDNNNFKTDTNHHDNDDYDDSCSNEVISFLVQTFPAACRITDDWNMLPLQYALYTKKTRCIQSLIDAYPEALSVALSSTNTVTPLSIANTNSNNKMDGVILNQSIPVTNTSNQHYNSAITRHISISKDYIYALAETASVDTIFQLIRYHPAALTI